MFEIVKKAIDEFNLYGLLPGAPSDEFDSESRKILGRITINSTVEEIAQVTCDVFSKSFNENFKLTDFKITAEKIYNSIKDN
ncbi:hypothetical protein [Clostridium intestinale]|uniref:Uncharacterized protein n=1 Tax=Clostridium intestinale TaxID=36845 RepID=A0A7D6VV64_9CLOT|nr:hypothetical protein [Clostridium intestinale]QLY81817.1 hypothetical protein HZF06_09600 [Clostridium intestinale]